MSDKVTYNDSFSFFMRSFLFLQSNLYHFKTVKRENNVVSSVYRLVRSYHIKVSLAAIIEYLKTHKDYPSLKSICDFFNEINIENHPLRVDLQDLYGIRRPFLVHLNFQEGRVLVVYKITKESVIYSDSLYGKKVIKIQEFLEKWNGVVIVVWPSNHTTPGNYKKNWHEEIIDKSFLPMTIVVLGIFGLLSTDFNFQKLESEKYLTISILFLHSTGLLFSILLARNEMNIKTQITEKLCHFSTLTDCDKVAASNASKLFGYITWADIGMAWFAGGLVLMSNFREPWILNLMGIFSFASLPYPVFSILYQKFKLRKWCPLCLVVQIVLIAEFILLFGFIEINAIHFAEMTFSLMTFIAILTVILLIKRTILLKREKNEIKLELVRMKRDPEIFIKRLLSREKVIFPSAEPTLSFGKPDEKVTITVFLSLLCSACARRFTEVIGMTKSLKSVRIWIIISPGRDEMTLELFRILGIYLKDGKIGEAIRILSEWYRLGLGSGTKLCTKYAVEGKIENAEYLAERSKLFFETCNITRVPAIFVNGYPLPRYYKVEDLKYLLNDTDIFEYEHDPERVKV